MDSHDAVNLISAALKPARGGASSLGGYVEIAADPGAEIGGDAGLAPNSVRTADFSASALDFMIVAATCICVFARLHGENDR